MFFTIDRKLRLQSSCQHQSAAMSINNEESLIAENCNDMEVLEKAISKLRQNPILSLIHPKHVTHNFWKIADGANIPPNEINISSIEVNYSCIKMFRLQFVNRLCYLRQMYPLFIN